MNATRNRYVPPFDPRNPPPRVSRKQAAEVLLLLVGLQTSPRSLETWPVPTRIVSRRATFDTQELLTFAHLMVNARPATMGGKHYA